IDAAVEGMKTSGEMGSVLSQKDIVVDGFPGRELELSARDGGYYGARIIVAETRLYILIAGGKWVERGEPNVRRFLDSFAVTDPRLKASGERRLAAAKQAEEIERVRKEQQERDRIAREKADAERKAAEARAAREREWRNRLMGEDALFKAADYKGAPPGAVWALSRGTWDVFNFPLDEVGFRGEGVTLRPERVASPGIDPVIMGAELGAGVRGKGAYLTPAARPGTLPPGRRDVPGPAAAVQNPNGFTIAGWARVRYAPVTVVSVHSDDQTVGEITVGRTHVTARVTGPDGKAAELTHPWTCDEAWHHVALVRATGATGAGAKLYFDGKLVASREIGAAPLPDQPRVSLGWLRYPDPKWPGPLGVDGAPGEPLREQAVAAIDECSVVGRPVSDDEIRVLYGSAKPRDIADQTTAPEPIDIKLTLGHKLAPVGAVAFDPARKAVWVADGPDKPAAKLTRPMLRKLSYPELKEVAAYELPGFATAGALDLPRNRLYLAICPPAHELPGDFYQWPRGTGHVHRYDLDEVARLPGGKLEPDAANGTLFGIRGLIASADGATVYLTALTPAAARGTEGLLRSEAHLYKLPADLTGAPAEVPELVVLCPERLERDPDTGGITVLAWNRALGRSRLATVDPPGGVALGFGANSLMPFDWVSVSPKRAFAAVPSGGAFAVPKALPAGHLSIARLGEGKSLYLGGLADGRYLVTAEARDGDPGRRVAIYSAYIGKGDGPGKAPAWSWEPLTELQDTADAPLGGPFWTAPDGHALIFRSGQIVRLQSRADLTPDPDALKKLAPIEPPPPVPGARPVAPRPRVRLTEALVPPATDLTGLKLYLTFDSADGVLRDAVTGAPAGKLGGPAALVDGPRGKAVRLVAPLSKGRPVTVPPEAGIQLTPKHLSIPANKPFAITFWARSSDVKPLWAPAVFRANDEVPTGKVTRATNFMFTDGSARFGISGGGERATLTGKVRPSEWNHFALVRDDKNGLRMFVNGQPAEDAKPVKCGSALDYTAAGLAVEARDWAYLDFDEFCLFDRELTDDEVARLAGRSKK
ncbi:MAG TPA: LamG-like jellyroll fold domain-containing protein, partial [Gemmata sp.]